MIIQKTIAKIHAIIAEACQAAHHTPDSVQLLAVSKTQGVDAIAAAYAAGQRAFGENYVQEALDKIHALSHLSAIEWHLIGPLQSNKTRAVAEHFAWVHSVDSLKLAQRLSAQRPSDSPPLQVCLQVNISGEANKSGMAPHEVLALAQAIHTLPNLQLRGLMCIPEASHDDALISQRFNALHDLRAECQAAGIPMDTLSMGMSADMPLAIAAGATIVRVGSAIFGERPKTQHDTPTRNPMKITFIGGGNMATALIAGLIQQGLSPQDIQVLEPNTDKGLQLQAQFGVNTYTEMGAWLKQSEVIVLAVKPQILHTVAQGLQTYLDHTQQHVLVISIAAGIRSADISRWLGGYRNIIRVMPNTPAMVQQGISGLYASAQITPAHKQHAEQLLRTVGQVIWVDEESQMDAITGISGSGPAYVFLMLEALQTAAEQQGFTPHTARQLALNTFKGAIALAEHSQDSLEQLRLNVTSKGGTTEQGVLALQQGQVPASIHQAVAAATYRAKQMGDEMGAS